MIVPLLFQAPVSVSVEPAPSTRSVPLLVPLPSVVTAPPLLAATVPLLVQRSEPDPTFTIDPAPLARSVPLLPTLALPLMLPVPPLTAWAVPWFVNVRLLLLTVIAALMPVRSAEMTPWFTSVRAEL